MAKDVSEKSSSSNNHNPDNTSPTSISDQQKVPPLRIVLNTSGNQKGPIPVNTNQPSLPPTDIKRDSTNFKPQDNAKADSNSVVKSGGKVRIKLGTNKQQVNKGSSSNDSTTTHQLQSEGAHKAKNQSLTSITDKQDNSSLNNNKDNREELPANYSHLRRITRRSQRVVQASSNVTDDEESMTSMTSTDENQNTTNNNNSDNTNVQDNATATATATTAASSSEAQPNTSSTGNNSNSNADSSRRYKRRKGETSESQSSEHDVVFTYQNYKLPNQNSFELYRNIRKQVEKKLKNLTWIHPKTPHGFRDYMLTRGAYLLDGNKLGNGTNLSMNEDGGLHTAPLIGKYHHAMRHNRLNYSVPNRAKVPLGLPVNSPLYNLFIDQEKERYRLRMQHIKEREKLTLAAEQEIVRVYNQAAMAAANQLEPFSACTMLKHQEVYNYMDSDGVTIQAAEDVQQDLEAAKQEGVRTRRRQHEHIGPPSTGRKTTSVNEEQKEEASSTPSNQQKEKTNSTTEETAHKSSDTKSEIPSKLKETSEGVEAVKSKTSDKEVDEKEKVKPSETSEKVEESGTGTSEIDNEKTKSNDNLEKNGDKSDINEVKSSESCKTENKDIKIIVANTACKNLDLAESVKLENKECASKEISDKLDPKTATPNLPTEIKKECEKDETTKQNQSNNHDEPINQDNLNESTATEIVSDQMDQVVAMDLDSSSGQLVNQERTNSNSQSSADAQANAEEAVLSDDDRRAYNKEVFLCQLQEVDDKWEKIRNDMLIRHKNEAESLHAVQRLEWEWKIKEIGACDVRSTPIIDNTLVPKLNIYSQDY